MVNTSAEAETAVRACRYFPLGNRSNAGVRGEWGEFKNYRDYLDTVNNGVVIVPMIETNQSLENLDAIASVPGVDVLLVGPSDLSIELGVPLDYQCDIYQRALDKIAATAAKHGIAAAMYFIPPGMDPNFFVQKGFKFFTMPWGPWAAAGIQNGLSVGNGIAVKNTAPWICWPAAVRLAVQCEEPGPNRTGKNDGTAGGTQDHHYRGRIGYRARHCPAVPAGRCGGRDPRPV
jgi:hypothetical protein